MGVFASIFSNLVADDEWERDAWPNDAKTELGTALKTEPDDEIRDRLSDLIAGRLED
jgi:hypothetical protein